MATIKSIEEKAKAYDEAKARMSRAWNDNRCTLDFMNEIFPELKESEDERIRKFIKDVLDSYGRSIKCPTKDILLYERTVAWLEKQGNLMKALQISNARIGELIEKNYYLKEQLEKQGELKKHDVCDNCEQQGSCVSPCPMKLVEKQGEQKPVFEMITPEESLGIDSETYSKIVDECVYGEQKPIKEHNACEFCEDRYGCVSPCSMKLIEEEKPADEIKPKFHEGDWLIYENGSIFYVNKVYEHTYELVIDNGDKPRIPHEIIDKKARLWTIQDAKDGDVLVSESNCGLGTWYCIFKSLDGDESMTVYCYLTRDGRFETKKELCFDKDPYNTKPATKEQCDTLMKAMADAGYKWDAERKELKNIDEEYNGEDYGIDGLYAAIDILQKTLGEVDGYQTDDGILTHKCAISAVKELSKQKPAWSEEDKDFMYDTLSNLTELKDRYGDGYGNVGKCIDWLKSLKERYTWKPSKREKEALLWCVVHLGGADKQTLGELLEALNKL